MIGLGDILFLPCQSVCPSVCLSQNRKQILVLFGCLVMPRILGMAAVRLLFDTGTNKTSGTEIQSHIYTSVLSTSLTHLNSKTVSKTKSVSQLRPACC